MLSTFLPLILFQCPFPNVPEVPCLDAHVPLPLPRIPCPDAPSLTPLPRCSCSYLDDFAQRLCPDALAPKPALLILPAVLVTLSLHSTIHFPLSLTALSRYCCNMLQPQKVEFNLSSSKSAEWAMPPISSAHGHTKYDPSNLRQKVKQTEIHSRRSVSIYWAHIITLMTIFSVNQKEPVELTMRKLSVY